MGNCSWKIRSKISVKQKNDCNNNQRLTDRAAGRFQNKQNQNNSTNDIHLCRIAAALSQRIKRSYNINIQRYRNDGENPVIDRYLVNVIFLQLKTDKAKKQAKRKCCHALNHCGEKSKQCSINLKYCPNDCYDRNNFLCPTRQMLQAIARLNFEIMKIYIHNFVFAFSK